MTAELPFDRDVDREHLEKRRAEELRQRRKGELKRELVDAGRRHRPPGSPPTTQRKQVRLTLDEENRLEAVAEELGMRPGRMIRLAALALIDRYRRIE